MKYGLNPVREKKRITNQGVSRVGAMRVQERLGVLLNWTLVYYKKIE
jgi:hypothetical protein